MRGALPSRWGRTTPWLVLAAMLALAWLAYWPGRHGQFLFDDLSNLAPLADYGRIDAAWKAVAFIASGSAGPDGRPLAMASFLLDARDWPAPIEAFRLTNVAIHLFNAALLAGLLSTLSEALRRPAREAAWIGVLGAGLWLLDPYWVNTTLYVVQRMAMLAATFCLAGLWAYAHGRQLLAAGRVRAAYAWMSTGLIVGTLLAVASKENGALLPLLAWGLDATVWRGARPPHRAWRLALVVLPSLLLLGALLSLWSVGAGVHGYTSWQRLLTESRILWSYIGDVWFPGARDAGLFHDDIAISVSPWQPASTLLALAGLGALVVLALRARRASDPRWIALSAAVVFFLVGHVMESTWVGLELAFDHRSYLPAALMFWPLSMAAITVAKRQGAPRYRILWGVAGLLLVFGVQTARQAQLWSEPFEQALRWARVHPESPRAQAYLADFWSDAGNVPEAERLLDAALSRHPRDLLLLISRAGAACDDGQAPQGLREALVHSASDADFGDGVVAYQFDQLLDEMQRCQVFGGGYETTLIAAALVNPSAGAPAVRRGLLHREALAALARRDFAAMWALDLQALRLPGTAPDARLRLAAEFGDAGRPALGLRLLDTVPSPLQSVGGWSMAAWRQRWLRHVGFYADSERQLRAELAREVARGGAVAQ